MSDEIEWTACARPALTCASAGRLDELADNIERSTALRETLARAVGFDVTTAPAVIASKVLGLGDDHLWDLAVAASGAVPS